VKRATGVALAADEAVREAAAVSAVASEPVVVLMKAVAEATDGAVTTTVTLAVLVVDGVQTALPPETQRSSATTVSV